jgi:hypothetical protein
MPEDPEVLLHSGPVPSAVGNVLKISLFDFVNHAGGIGKVIFAGGVPEFKTIIEWKAEAPNAGQEVDPWKEKPEYHPDESGPPATEEKEEGKEGGHQKGQGTQFTEEKGPARAQGYPNDQAGQDNKKLAHVMGKKTKRLSKD